MLRRKPGEYAISLIHIITCMRNNYFHQPGVTATTGWQLEPARPGVTATTGWQKQHRITTRASNDYGHILRFATAEIIHNTSYL